MVARRSCLFAAALASAALAPRAAWADRNASGVRAGTASVGVRLGVAVPFTGLRTGPAAELEGGYVLDAMERRLRIVATIGVARGTLDGRRADPRFEGDPGFELVVEELVIGAGVLYEFARLADDALVVYGFLTPRLVLLRSRTDGDANAEAYGRNTETSMTFGAAAATGMEYALGPGAAFAEIRFAWSPLAHRTTGDASTSAFEVAVGYRLAL